MLCKSIDYSVRLLTSAVLLSVLSYMCLCATMILQSGVPERARWLNTLADTLWQPILEPALSGLIQVHYMKSQIVLQLLLLLNTHNKRTMIVVH
jgi:hypothetical protein